MSGLQDKKNKLTATLQLLSKQYGAAPYFSSNICTFLPILI